jgi:hypothetical protein
MLVLQLADHLHAERDAETLLIFCHAVNSLYDNYFEVPCGTVYPVQVLCKLFCIVHIRYNKEVSKHPLRVVNSMQSLHKDTNNWFT